MLSRREVLIGAKVMNMLPVWVPNAAMGIRR